MDVIALLFAMFAGTANGVVAQGASPEDAVAVLAAGLRYAEAQRPSRLLAPIVMREQVLSRDQYLRIALEYKLADKVAAAAGLPVKNVDEVRSCTETTCKLRDTDRVYGAWVIQLGPASGRIQIDYDYHSAKGDYFSEGMILLVDRGPDGVWRVTKTLARIAT